MVAIRSSRFGYAIPAKVLLFLPTVRDFDRLAMSQSPVVRSHVAEGFEVVPDGGRPIAGIHTEYRLEERLAVWPRFASRYAQKSVTVAREGSATVRLSNAFTACCILGGKGQEWLEENRDRLVDCVRKSDSRFRLHLFTSRYYSRRV
jgi:hypothetical protein